MNIINFKSYPQHINIPHMKRVLSSLHAFCFPLPCEKNTNKLLVIQLYCTTSQVSYCYKFPRKKKARKQGCGDVTALLVFLQKKPPPASIIIIHSSSPLPQKKHFVFYNDAKALHVWSVLPSKSQVMFHYPCTFHS